MVDVAANRLLSYNPTGRSLSLPEPSIPNFLPAAIAQGNAADLFLQLKDGDVVQLDRTSFSTTGGVLLRHTQASGPRIGSMYQWKIAGHYLVAFGVMFNSKNDQLLGFYRVPLWAESQDPEMLTESRDIDYYLLGNEYITSIGDAVYYLVMSKAPAIFRVLPGQKPVRLHAFPDEFRTRPDFRSKMTGPKSAPAHFAELETLRVASGLFSQDTFLYVLARKPIAKGTGWYLFKIDPKADKIVSSMRLPTVASHLTVATSRARWFIIQRGPVGTFQRQTIESMVVIESDAIRSSRDLSHLCVAVGADPERPRAAN